MTLRKATLLMSVAALCFVVASPAWAATSICDAVAGNLVTNCGFETGSFTGWTQSGNLDDTFVGPTANSGVFGAQMGPVGTQGFLSQTVGDNSTIYNVSFYLASDGGTPISFTVYWNGIDVGPDVTDPASFGYTIYSTVLPGNSGAGSNELSFAFQQTPGYWFLDDVVVTNAVLEPNPVPEPSSLLLLGSGLIGLAGVVRRKLGA